MIRPEDTPEFKTGSIREARKQVRNIPIDFTKSEASSGSVSITRRGRLARAGAGLALTSLATVLAVNASRPSNNHEFTNDQLGDMKQQSITVQPGEGLDHAVERVDPQLANDPQGLSDVEVYLSPQLSPDHQLDQAQQLNVPVTPK